MYLNFHQPIRTTIYYCPEWNFAKNAEFHSIFTFRTDYDNIKSLMADLKKVFQAINEDKELNALVKFKEKWHKTYISCVKSWEDNLHYEKLFKDIIPRIVQFVEHAMNLLVQYSQSIFHTPSPAMEIILAVVVS